MLGFQQENGLSNWLFVKRAYHVIILGINIIGCNILFPCVFFIDGGLSQGWHGWGVHRLWKVFPEIRYFNSMAPRSNFKSVIIKLIFRIDILNNSYEITLSLPLSEYSMMTSSNGNIFRVTGHLCGEFTGPRCIPRTKASDAELWWVFFHLRLNKRLSK